MKLLMGPKRKAADLEGVNDENGNENGDERTFMDLFDSDHRNNDNERTFMDVFVGDFAGDGELTDMVIDYGNVDGEDDSDVERDEGGRNRRRK